MYWSSEDKDWAKKSEDYRQIYLPPKAKELLKEASEGTWGPHIAKFWTYNPKKYIALNEVVSSEKLLLACGVPLDLISTEVHPELVKQLPWWQKGEKPGTHQCAMRDPVQVGHDGLAHDQTWEYSCSCGATLRMKVNY